MREGLDAGIPVEVNHEQQHAEYPGDRFGENDTGIAKGRSQPEGRGKLDDQLEYAGSQGCGFVANSLQSVAVDEQRSEEKEEQQVRPKIQGTFLNHQSDVFRGGADQQADKGRAEEHAAEKGDQRPNGGHGIGAAQAGLNAVNLAGT